MQRALCAITLLDPRSLTPTLEVLFNASFVDRKDVVSKDILLDLLATVHGKRLANEIIEKVFIRFFLELRMGIG